MFCLARHLHKVATVMISLLTTKTRVAPIKELSIPHLKLCSAKLLTQLISATAADIGVPTSNFYGCVLDCSPGQVEELRDPCLCAIEPLLLPASKWHYVMTNYNPA